MHMRRRLTILAAILIITAMLQGPAAGTDVGLEVTWTIPLPSVEVPVIRVEDEDGTVIDSKELIGSVGGEIEITWISSGTVLPPTADIETCGSGATLRLERVAGGSSMEVTWWDTNGTEEVWLPSVAVGGDWPGYTLDTCAIVSYGENGSDQEDQGEDEEDEPTPPSSGSSSRRCPEPPEHADEHAQDDCPPGGTDPSGV